MIVENKYLDQIETIWQGNNKGYIGYECNQRSIKDDKMLKIVYEEENLALGYCVLYFKKDFCELEKYPNKIKNMPEKTAYIWEIVTDKNHIGKGIATSILSYIKDKFKGYSIYSCINLSNIPSLNLHSKIGFNTIYKFNQDSDEYAMMELKNI